MWFIYIGSCIAIGLVLSEEINKPKNISILNSILIAMIFNWVYVGFRLGCFFSFNKPLNNK